MFDHDALFDVPAPSVPPPIDISDSDSIVSLGSQCNTFLPTDAELDRLLRIVQEAAAESGEAGRHAEEAARELFLAADWARNAADVVQQRFQILIQALVRHRRGARIPEHWLEWHGGRPPPPPPYPPSRTTSPSSATAGAAAAQGLGVDQPASDVGAASERPPTKSPPAWARIDQPAGDAGAASKRPL